MSQRSALFLSLIPLLLIAACAANTRGQSSGMMTTGMRMDAGMMQRHMATLPAEYAYRANPVAVDAASLMRGKTIYEAKCMTCHGDTGRGDGPAAANLNPPPAPIAHTAPMLSDAYMFYRISEGGGLAPFSSAMPMWRDKLSETERWDVINYVRSFGGNSMMNEGMMEDSLWWMMTPWWFLGWALLIGVIVAIILVVVWAVRRPRRSAEPGETPLDILKRRYAQGGISTEQFEVMKRQLSEGERMT